MSNQKESQAVGESDRRSISLITVWHDAAPMALFELLVKSVRDICMTGADGTLGALAIADWVIVDDSTPGIESAVPAVGIVKYQHYNDDAKRALYMKVKSQMESTRGRMLPKHSNWFHKMRLPVGLMRNLACEMATGDIIVHLEVGYYYSPEAIRSMIAPLTSPSIPLTYSTSMNCYVPEKFVSFRTEPNRRSLEANAQVASLAYWRRTWESGRFDPQATEHECLRFVKGHKKRSRENAPAMVELVFKVPKDFKDAESNGWHYGPVDDAVFGFISDLAKS